MIHFNKALETASSKEMEKKLSERVNSYFTVETSEFLTHPELSVSRETTIPKNMRIENKSIKSHNIFPMCNCFFVLAHYQSCAKK